MPAWHEIRMRVATELGEPVHDGQPLTPPRTSRMTWAARTPGTGAIVVKARRGDSAFEKTQWCAEHLPALGARGYPVPAILWHGMIGDELHVTVQNRIPGRPLKALGGPVLEAVLRLIELQADAGFQDVVDWDEFALGSRALDLVVLAIDCERGGDHAVADRLLARAARVAGGDGLRCLVSYRAIALLAHSAREREAYGDSLADAECAAVSAVLDRLEALPARPENQDIC